MNLPYHTNRKHVKPTPYPPTDRAASTGTREDIRQALAAGVPYGGTPSEPRRMPDWNHEWYLLAEYCRYAQRVRDKRYWRSLLTGMANARYMLNRERKAKAAA